MIAAVGIVGENDIPSVCFARPEAYNRQDGSKTLAYTESSSPCHIGLSNMPYQLPAYLAKQP